MIVDYLKNCRTFTYSEKNIRDFIVNNPQLFVDLSITELALKCNVGVASIDRFCKKLNFSGFKEFKTMFLKEYKDLEQLKIKDSMFSFESNTTLKDIVNLLPYVYEKSIGYTQMTLNFNVLNRSINRIQNSHTIIFCTGLNKPIAEMFVYKLNELGLECTILDTVHHQMIDALVSKKINIFCILLSHTGSNKMIIDALALLKEKKIHNLLITSHVLSTKRHLMDDILLITPTHTTKELSNIQYMIAEQYILDIIYSGLLVKNIKLIEQISNDSKYRKYYMDEEKINEI